MAPCRLSGWGYLLGVRGAGRAVLLPLAHRAVELVAEEGLAVPSVAHKECQGSVAARGAVGARAG